MGLLNRGNTAAVTLRKPLPVNDVTFASTIVTKTDALSAAAGAAGTKGSIICSFAPIASAIGDLVGNFNDKSLVITSTALTTEVPFELVMARASADQNQSTVGEGAPDYKAYLTNGEFYVIYETSRIFYCKADASTAVSAAYKYRGGATSSGPGSVVDITKVGGTDVPTTSADGLGNDLTQLPVTARISGFNGVGWDRIRAGIIAAGSPTGHLNTLPGAIYRTTPLSKVDGQVSVIESDSLGNQKTTHATQIAGENLIDGFLWTNPLPTSSATGAIVLDVSAALEASTISKATAGRMYSMYGRIDKTAPTADYWIHTVNSATLPADGAVTRLMSFKKSHVTGTDTPIEADMRVFGLYGSLGLVTYISTTEFTKTISGAYLSTVIEVSA